MTLRQSFAQQEMGQVLFLLSEFRQSALQWLYEAEIDQAEGVAGVNAFVDFGHDLTIYPVAGLPWLSLSAGASLSLSNSSASIWWTVNLHLVSNGEQNISSRLRTESHVYAEPGPHTLEHIQPYQALSTGQSGVYEVEDVCQRTLNHLKTTLSTNLPTQLYETYKIQLAGTDFCIAGSLKE